MSLSTEELVRRLVYTFYRESPSSYTPPNLLVREILDIGDAADDVHGNILIVKHVKGNKHVVVDVTGGDIAIVDSIIRSAVARSDSNFWL
ncbi:hypothetical protein DFH29DRAFT_1009445 [Suillus ampliporus]|nr:hypothetical protein DFH29DRAFT_1009445 [Suillus ampliporus]